MILGKLKVKAIYVKPDASARPQCSYKVFCACCAKQQSGPGSRSYANRELKECGWTFDRKRGGWRCGVCSRTDQATIAEVSS
jgi:hypothetical protein